MEFGFSSIADGIRASRLTNCPEDGDGIIRNTAKFKLGYKSSLHKILQFILIYFQLHATLHSLFISGKPLYCFGWYLHHHQEHIRLYLQYLIRVKPLLLPTTIVEELELV